MSEDRSILSARVMRWTLFSLLFLIAPALLFLVQAFMFIPTVFFAAGILYMIPKLLNLSHFMETLVFMGFFAVHLLIHAGVYLLISAICAKLLSLIPNIAARGTVFAILCLSVASLALFPFYGSGGHGGTRWLVLLDVFQEVNRDYGSYTVALTYGAFFACLFAWIAIGKRRRNKIQNDRP